MSTPYNKTKGRRKDPLKSLFSTSDAIEIKLVKNHAHTLLISMRFCLLLAHISNLFKVKRKPDVFLRIP